MASLFSPFDEELLHFIAPSALTRILADLVSLLFCALPPVFFFSFSPKLEMEAKAEVEAEDEHEHEVEAALTPKAGACENMVGNGHLGTTGLEYRWSQACPNPEEANSAVEITFQVSVVWVMA